MTRDKIKAFRFVFAILGRGWGGGECVGRGGVEGECRRSSFFRGKLSTGINRKLSHNYNTALFLQHLW